IAVDNYAGTGQGDVYLTWRRFPASANGDIRFIRSTDGGSTWLPNMGMPLVTLPSATDNAQGAYVTVGPDHSVYVFWYSEPTSGSASLLMRKSTDQGVTFDPSVQVTLLNGTGANGDLGLNGGFQTNSFPQAVVNPVNGNVYIVYNDDPSGADHGDIFLRKS